MTGSKAPAGQNNGGREAQKRLAGIRKELAALAEPDYAAFAAKLLRKPQEAVPGGSAARLLGVRLPALRKMAARLAKEDWAGNLEALEGAGDGAAFEEIMLRGFLIGQAKIAPGKAFALIRGFLPCVDNWSLCDSLGISIPALSASFFSASINGSPLASISNLMMSPCAPQPKQ